MDGLTPSATPGYGTHKAHGVSSSKLQIDLFLNSQMRLYPVATNRSHTMNPSSSYSSATHVYMRKEEPHDGRTDVPCLPWQAPSHHVSTSVGDRTSCGFDAKPMALTCFEHDPLPTPWRTTLVTQERFQITRKERLVREEKYYIAFDATQETLYSIQRQMDEKGWDLRYQFRQPNSEASLISCVVSIPSEFGLSFPDILKDLRSATGEDVQN